MNLKTMSAMLVIGCAVAGCGGGGSKGNSNANVGSDGSPPMLPTPTPTPTPMPSPTPAPTPTPTPSPTALDFTAFVKTLLAADERTDPVDVTSMTFSFDRDDDPTAYDDSLPPQG